MITTTTNLDTNHDEFKWSIIVLFASISFFIVVIPTSDKQARIGAAWVHPPHRSGMLGNRGPGAAGPIGWYNRRRVSLVIGTQVIIVKLGHLILKKRRYLVFTQSKMRTFGTLSWGGTRPTFARVFKRLTADSCIWWGTGRSNLRLSPRQASAHGFCHSGG